MHCQYCLELIPDHIKFCDWNCYTKYMEINSPKQKTEFHHPNYKFTVTVLNDYNSETQVHDVVYIDTNIVLTFYQNHYVMWKINGQSFGYTYIRWEISPNDILKIKEFSHG